MADDPREALTPGVSDTELERRWAAARAVMKERSIDVLIMQDTNEWLGGYVKWFTDVSARNGYPMTVIFPVDDLMTTITSGGRPPGDMGPPAWHFRGAKARLSAPYFPSIIYSTIYDAELVVAALKDRKNGRIGMLGQGRISYSFYD